MKKEETGGEERAPTAVGPAIGNYKQGLTSPHIINTPNTLSVRVPGPAHLFGPKMSQGAGALHDDNGTLYPPSSE